MIHNFPCTCYKNFMYFQKGLAIKSNKNTKILTATTQTPFIDTYSVVCGAFVFISS